MRASFLLALVVLTGCATQGKNTFQYNQPTKTAVANEVTIAAPYSKVWDVLVRDLAKSFYVINNIDKESRIVNVSFSSTEPQEFIDCGQSVRSYTEGSSVERFDYVVAGKATFKTAADQQEHPAFSNYAVITRETMLEGRSNIYVAPLETDPSKTTVSVNTRYVLSIKVKGEAYAKHISGNVFPRGRLPEDTSTLMFNTNTVGTKEQPGYPALTCSSKGKLEADVLDIVRKL